MHVSPLEGCRVVAYRGVRQTFLLVVGRALPTREDEGSGAWCGVA